MGAFLEHSARKGNGRTRPNAVTSDYSSAPRTLRGLRQRAVGRDSGPRAATTGCRAGASAAALGAGKRRCPSGARSGWVRGPVGHTFRRHKHHPLGFLMVEIISFLMRAPLWRELPRTELSQDHLVLRAGPLPRPLPRPAPRPPPPAGPLRAPPWKPGLRLGSRTKEAI